MSGLEYASPLDSMYRTQNVLMRGQQMKAQAEDDARTQNMNALYQQNGGDPVKTQQALIQSGDMQGAMQFAKINAGAQQAQQESKLSDLSYRQKAHEYLGNRIYNSGSQQELDAIHDEGRQMLGAEMDNLPREWSPEMAKRYGEASMTFAQKEAMQQKRDEAQMRYDDRAESRALRREMAGSRQDKPVNWSTVQTADGFAQVNPQTGEVRPVTMGGKQAQPKPSATANGVGSPTQKAQDAQDAIALIQQARGYLDTATASTMGNARDVAAGVFGVSTQGAQSAAKLKALEGALMMKQPRMSGPQSDKDVLLYKQMAAQVGDPTVPKETRMAALDAIEQLQSRYAGTQNSTQTPANAPTMSGW